MNLRNLIRKTNRDERGITGLETAIILIAFVVVATVFAFVVLTTGIFSAERGKETVFAGLAKARGTMEVRGGVVVSDDDVAIVQTGITARYHPVLGRYDGRWRGHSAGLQRVNQPHGDRLPRRASWSPTTSSTRRPRSPVTPTSARAGRALHSSRSTSRTPVDAVRAERPCDARDPDARRRRDRPDAFTSGTARRCDAASLSRNLVSRRRRLRGTRAPSYNTKAGIAWS